VEAEATGSSEDIELLSYGYRWTEEGVIVYSAAKFALEGMTESLRMEVSPFDIKVVLVEPGDMKTGFTANRVTAAGAEKKGSPYGDSFRRAIEVMEKDEASGPPPEKLARLVEKIISNKAPRLRYSFGPFSQTGAILLKRLLPQKIFESSLMKYYKIKKK